MNLIKTGNPGVHAIAYVLISCLKNNIIIKLRYISLLCDRVSEEMVYIYILIYSKSVIVIILYCQLSNQWQLNGKGMSMMQVV